MKRDCNTCVYKEGSCYPSTMIFDKDKTCKSYVPDYEDYIAELEKENAELKEKLGDVQMQKAEQLTEAKKVIEELYNIIPASMADYAKEPMEHARKFFTEEVENELLENKK